MILDDTSILVLAGAYLGYEFYSIFLMGKANDGFASWFAFSS